MQKSVFVTCAPAGSDHAPTISEDPLITTDQIARVSIDAAAVGASIFHPHARVLEIGKIGVTPNPCVPFLLGMTRATCAVIAAPEAPWAAMKDPETGCGMSLGAPDDQTAQRHLMIAHA